jgi:hypothetical protein
LRQNAVAIKTNTVKKQNIVIQREHAVNQEEILTMIHTAKTKNVIHVIKKNHIVHAKNLANKK